MKKAHAKPKQVNVSLENVESVPSTTKELSLRYRMALACALILAFIMTAVIIVCLLLFHSRSNSYIWAAQSQNSDTGSTIPPTTTSFNSCALQWNTTKIIVAGNINGAAGTSASELSRPRGIFIDRNDYLYIADNFNHRIQRWGINDTVGTTVAGSANGTLGWTASLLDSPTFIQVDSSLNMYILDMWNLRVLQWLSGASGGSTIAGTGVQGNTSSSFNQAFTMFVDTSNSKTYLADLMNNRIMILPFFASTSSFIIPLIGLVGVTVDSSGNVFATSNSANTLTRFPQGSTSGDMLITNGLYYPWAVRFDIYGNLYVASDGSGTIVMFCAGFTSNSTGVVVASGLNQPLDIAFDSNMNMYVCEYGNNRIVKFLKLP